jgi:hypothetical protein
MKSHFLLKSPSAMNQRDLTSRLFLFALHDSSILFSDNHAGHVPRVTLMVEQLDETRPLRPHSSSDAVSNASTHFLDFRGKRNSGKVIIGIATITRQVYSSCAVPRRKVPGSLLGNAAPQQCPSSVDLSQGLKKNNLQDNDRVCGKQLPGFLCNDVHAIR